MAHSQEVIGNPILRGYGTWESEVKVGSSLDIPRHDLIFETGAE